MHLNECQHYNTLSYFLFVHASYGRSIHELHFFVFNACRVFYSIIQLPARTLKPNMSDCLWAVSVYGWPCNYYLFLDFHSTWSISLNITLVVAIMSRSHCYECYHSYHFIFLHFLSFVFCLLLPLFSLALNYSTLIVLVSDSEQKILYDLFLGTVCTLGLLSILRSVWLFLTLHKMCYT